MAAYKKMPNFIDTEDGQDFIEKLKKMAIDVKYNTGASYSTNSDLYPDNLIPFVNKHVDYIRKYPSMDPYQYLANLRLMTRVR